MVIYANDHPPPHVHAVRADEVRAKFVLNCPDGPVELFDNDGFRSADLQRIGEAIADNLAAICRKWSEIHG